MPHLTKLGNRYTGSIQCGAGRDAYLQFELSDYPCSDFDVQPVPWSDMSKKEVVDPLMIKDSVEKAVSHIETKYNRLFHVKAVWYLPYDSTHYDIHCRVVYVILRNIIEGGEFSATKTDFLA